MKKSSKKTRGPVTEDKDVAPTEMPILIAAAERVAPMNLIECLPGGVNEVLEPEEQGIQIFIFAPKHSKSFKKLAADHFRRGLVDASATVRLPDGQSIQAGATVKTEMRPELKRMLRAGVFLAGKAPRRS